MGPAQLWGVISAGREGDIKSAAPRVDLGNREGGYWAGYTQR